MKDLLRAWASTRPTRTQYLKAALLGFCGALGFQAVGCMLDLRESSSEAHPIGWMQAEQLARQGIRDFHERVFGPKARQTSDSWSVVNATYVRRSFMFHYRLTDQEGNIRYYSLDVQFDENGVASISFL